MHVFVTGAAGFIGWNLVRLLLVRGHRVTALVHKEADAAKFGRVERAVVGDVRYPQTYEHAAKDADAIAHLALPDVRSKFRVAHPTWVEGTRSLLAIATERKMRAFVHASGCVGTYRHEPGAWVDENAPIELATRLTRARGETVAMVHDAHRRAGIPVAVMRPPFVYGRGGAFQQYFVDYMRRGRYRVVGRGTNYIPFVHVQDCALAYALALERAKSEEEYIVVDDGPVTLRDASDAIAGAVGAKRPGSVPAMLAALVIGRDAVKLVTESIRPRNAKLKERLGWTPRYPTLRDGLPSVVA